MVEKFPYKICNKAVTTNHQNTLQRYNYHLWIHIKCNRINLETYKYLQKCSSIWYCLKCYEETILFTTISNNKLYQTNQGCKINFTAITKKDFLKQDLINQLNDAMDDPMAENVSINPLHASVATLAIWTSPLMKNVTNNTSFFYLNISFLCFHIEELTTLGHDFSFTIIGIS